MASPFKIPKKKQPSDSAPLHTSPLARLQSSAPEFKSYGGQSSRGRADRMHAGNSSWNRQSDPLFRNVVKTLLGLNRPNTAANHRGAAAAANHRGAAAAANHRGAAANHRGAAAANHNGWRPKRASDRLLLPDGTSERPSPPQKKKKSDLPGESCEPSDPFSSRSISVDSLDSLAQLRGDGHAGSLSSPAVRGRTWRRRDAAAEGEQQSSSPSGSDQTSEDDSVSPSRNKPAVMSPRTAGERRRSLDRTAWITAASSSSSDSQSQRSSSSSSDLLGDLREKERERWREFRERKNTVLHLRLKKPTHSEPIVLSSEEEEEEGEDEGDGGRRTSQSQLEESEPTQAQQAPSGETDEFDPPPPPPSFLQLDFISLHAGLTHAHANGKMMITENGVTLPLKGGEEEDGEVTVVASQVRGYGVWDGGVAQEGTLLAGWKGPAPSLLFLWVTDAQANLLQKELSSIQTSTQTLIQTPIQTSNQTPIQTSNQTPNQTSNQTSNQISTTASGPPGPPGPSGPPCSFLLLVLKEQLQELQAALLNSILDMEEYRRGCSSSGPASPLDWTHGLLLLHSCPPPLDQHLLGLLGHSATRTIQKTKTNLNSSGRQQLPTRLIQYPAAPCKGRITVAKEDLACLGDGEFLNDVIIDFYLKFLLLEGVGGSVANRCHIFSSFFYKQLSRRRAAGEDDAPSVPDRHVRHQRVKTWTRHVDIFTKDFLLVPVNQEAHWFLVLVCFPGLEEVQYQKFSSPTGGSERSAGKPSSFSLRSQRPPECTEQSWQRDTVLKRPCIVVMDSLKLSYHDNVCRLLREYLQVEWEVRRGTPHLFTSDSMRSSNCRVPQQNNSSDCGLYLLQYAESFLQNPVVNFDLPLRLDSWFPRQRVRQKREEIRSLIMRMHQSQNGGN
ncbi:sentrin-specific protease 7b isoform X2 [Sebastes umbrosus]|uniref:sentrin-specific protease 7b isoform X2 n=1 Tax=Sebastes umbrosus TaxID=72105 RepID=UPI00189D26C1|nr:sentrin-specific protease 7b isoform X2 [Sebastes umbrosus]